MKISVRLGDITDAPTDAICTSTNSRLSLMMGTGGAVREQGGFEVLRACENLVDEEFARNGRRVLPVGSAHVTTAGKLPYKAIIHCVASDSSHRSSAEVIRRCVVNALALADAAGCKSIAMPLFSTGHARFKPELAAAVIGETLREARTSVQHVVITVDDAQRADEAERVLRGVIGEVSRI
jgi:O-acetyl-ADP-ribose deacetylase